MSTHIVRMSDILRIIPTRICRRFRLVIHLIVRESESDFQRKMYRRSKSDKKVFFFWKPLYKIRIFRHDCLQLVLNYLEKSREIFSNSFDASKFFVFSILLNITIKILLSTNYKYNHLMKWNENVLKICLPYEL